MDSLKVGTSAYDLRELPAQPDAITWGLQDVSSPDAGRVQDANATMFKNRVTQKRKLQLSWTNPSLEDASAILRAFDPEYVFVQYVDVLDGGFAVREFYTGDKSAPFRMISNPLDGSTLSTLSFDVIER